MGHKIDLDTLSPAEKAALPGRIRALERDEHTTAWAQAKAERDAALAAAVNEDGSTDLEAADAAKAAWAERKAELIASAPPTEEE